MGYRVSDTRCIGKRGVYGERHNAPRPTELCPRDNYAACYISLIGELSGQPLHFIDTTQYDITLEDGLPVDDRIFDGAVPKRIAFDKT